MARGDFLSGLSSGIFERLGGIRQEQEEKDAQSKAQVIQMLSGLSDKIEPDSLPLLLGHMWDTMGIKKQSSGKGLRGFLDAFGGVPNRSIEDQLGTKLRSLTEGMVGPQQAKDVRMREGLSQKGIPGLMQAAPTSSYGQKAQSDAQGLKSKMVFRDPYQEKIGALQAQYGAQLENQRSMQEARHTDRINALNAQAALREEAANKQNERVLNRAVESQAKLYMSDPAVTSLPPTQQLPAAREMARNFLMGLSEDKRENIIQGTELKKSLIGENDREAKAGGSPSVQLSRDRLDYTKDQDRMKIEEDISKSQATFDTFTKQVESKGAAVDAWAKRYKKTREELMGSTFSTIGPIGKSIKEYQEALKTQQGSKADLDLKKKQLTDFDAQRGKTATPPPKAVKKGAIRISEEQGKKQGYMPGDIRNISGKDYVIRELKGGWWVLDPK